MPNYPRRDRDAYAGQQTINAATAHPIYFDVLYQHETGELASTVRGSKSPGEPGYACAGWYWMDQSDPPDWRGPYTSSRAAFRDAVAILTRANITIKESA